MGKKQLFSSFQQLGKVLMTPVMILPIAGIMMGIGSAFTSTAVQQAIPFLTNEVVVMILKLIKDAGNVVFDNLPVIFAISIAIGYAKKEKGIAALSAFLGYLAFNKIMGSLLISLGQLDPANLLTGQKAILGIPALDTGVFGGIIMGFIVVWLHNRYYNISLPPIFSIFNGTRFIPVVSILSSIVMGVAAAFIWPSFQAVLIHLSDLIKGTGAAGSFIYGFTERSLLPFGLHHFVYLPFFFTSLGGSMVIDGKTVEGAINIYQAMLSSKDALFNIDVTRFAMNGKVLFAMFGLPAAGLAIYHTAKPENKKRVGTLMIASIIPCIFMGITEPIEFAFLFAAPLLFGIHAIFAGFAYMLAYIFEINIPGSSAFGGPFISFIFNGVLQGAKGSNFIWVPILGIPYFVAYYFSFRFAIQKFNLKTPGREEETVEEAIGGQFSQNDLIYDIIEALGGKDNILNVDACFTRLRVKVKDKTKVADLTHWKKLGANGFIMVSDGVQVIYGPKADVYKTSIREVLGVA
ncbi:PTS transporter subunit EIIC [Neobacillus sp. SAB-20_R2A]|uniref:PTS transporter subunit EIIC n=1 Tax=Neobacillus sp. SAB-20_R2A TaxID=3120519 RepID=UPI003C6E4E12